MVVESDVFHFLVCQVGQVRSIAALPIQASRLATRNKKEVSGPVARQKLHNRFLGNKELPVPNVG